MSLGWGDEFGLINRHSVTTVRSLTEFHKTVFAAGLALGICACSNPEADRALIEAAKGGNLEQVNLAISDWGDVDAKGGKLMATPLHYATVHGHTAIVERLLDILHPDDEPGRMTFIHRYGADRIEEHQMKFAIFDLLVPRHGLDERCG